MKTATFFFLLQSLVIIGSFSQSSQKVEPVRPNIVYILADDMGYGDLSCYGQKHFSTPNIDRLAKEGMLFTQHYSGSTVCAPSRSSLLTGQTTGHTFIRGNKEVEPEGQFPIEAKAFTIAELLKEADYTTGAFGKWGNGYPGSEGDPNMKGFDEFYGYNCHMMAHSYYPGHLWDNQTKVILEGNSGDKFETYAPYLIHQRALKFIEKNKEKPFFLFYPSPIPHAELLVPEKELEKFRGKFLPEKIYNGALPGDKDFRIGAYGKQTECHAAFAAMITILDRQVGEVLDKLKEHGLENNTIVIFTSDNGPHMEGGADPEYFDSNGPLRGFKRDLYEGGIRVPMLVRWPGKVQAESKSNHISAFWDIMPTFADIVDAKTPENIDGISMLPTFLSKKGQKQHEYLYWEFHELGGRKGIRKSDWKLVRYNINDPGKITTELYNLKTDLGENNNVADSNPEIVKELISLMDSARTESEFFNFQAPTIIR